MIHERARYLDVVSLQGRRMCIVCGEKPAGRRSRFCDGQCRWIFEHVVYTDPAPREISARMKAIRRRWDRETRDARRVAAGALSRLQGTVYLAEMVMLAPVEHTEED